GIWELGADTDPAFTNRIELHLPDGKVYIAKTSGTEVIMGKTVQKGIGARILEWGNTLIRQSYLCNEVNATAGGASWCVPNLTNGQPTIKYDPNVKTILPSGAIQSGRPGCNATENTSCTCSSNNACVELSKYQE